MVSVFPPYIKPLSRDSCHVPDADLSGRIFLWYVSSYKTLFCEWEWVWVQPTLIMPVYISILALITSEGLPTPLANTHCHPWWVRLPVLSVYVAIPSVVTWINNCFYSTDEVTGSWSWYYSRKITQNLELCFQCCCWIPGMFWRSLKLLNRLCLVVVSLRLREKKKE